jgi:hypothetical protein
MIKHNVGLRNKRAWTMTTNLLIRFFLLISRIFTKNK